jgi:hypothetical protein
MQWMAGKTFPSGKQETMNGRLFTLASLATALLVGLASPAQAQHFAVQFGSYGGGHHHHHHGCYGGYPGFGFYYAPPPVTYVYPAPVRREIYVVPQATSPLTQSINGTVNSGGLARVEARPNLLPSQSTAVSSSSANASTVIVSNPVQSGGTVDFVIDGNVEVSLRPGESRALTNGSSYLVEFDRGGNYGLARRTLGQGTFDFVPTASGWDLVSRAAAQSATRISPKHNDLPSGRLR